MRTTIKKYNGHIIFLSWNFYGLRRRWFWFVVNDLTEHVIARGWSIAGESKRTLMKYLKSECDKGNNKS